MLVIWVSSAFTSVPMSFARSAGDIVPVEPVASSLALATSVCSDVMAELFAVVCVVATWAAAV